MITFLIFSFMIILIIISNCGITEYKMNMLQDINNKLKDKIDRLEKELGVTKMENEDFRHYLSEIHSKANRKIFRIPWDQEYIAALAKRALEKNKNE